MSFLKLPTAEWNNLIAPHVDPKDMRELEAKVKAEYESDYEILPKKTNIFRALSLTAPDDVRVVILGQDPYPNPDNASGLAFSTNPGQSVPLSLQNIFKERQADLGIPVSNNPDLHKWAENGVLLLNTTLTVRAGQSNSHEDLGWSELTDAIIKGLCARNQPIVFILWGKNAQSKEALIPKRDNLKVIKSSHPSPFSANISFYGSHPFSTANHFLEDHNVTAIDWNND